MPALSGMRVLDMTQYEAGTSCTQVLAWLGAEVVKVEPPGGDPGRQTAPGVAAVSQYFLNYNSNKQSIVIDLGRPEGRDLLLRLVPKFDVFVENYGPGVIEKLAIGYDVMRGINPGIIFCRIKGFGLSGPYAGYRSYDWVAQASAGTFSVNGPAGGPPVRPAPTMGDSGTGIQMALAITAAYVQKLNTGEGQQIEISMQEAVTMFMRTMGLRSWAKEPAARTGSRTGPPTDVYPCAPGGINDYVFIMANTTRMWDTLCITIERPELLNDPRFETIAERVQNFDQLHEEISAWTRLRTKHEAMQILADAGVPCSAVMDTVEIFNDPHLNERGFIHTVEHPVAGPVKLLGFPPRMSASHVPLQPAPMLGDHTDAVLGHELDLCTEEITTLREQGIVR
jgi:formyl-CoA transferase